MITGSHEMAAVAERMRRAASAVLESLPVEQRGQVQTGFGGPEQREWTYFPGARPGVALADLGADSRALAFDLLATAYGERGLADAQRVIQVESISRELGRRPEPALLYWLRISGDPGGADPWAWRISGHHLVAAATIAGDQVSATPHFFGASPARVPSGPHAGFRPLARAEDLARALVSSLQPDQFTLAVVAAEAPAEIASRIDPVAAPLLGPALSIERLDAAQRELLDALIGEYLNRVAAPVANRAWAELRDSWAAVGFRWAGPLEPGRPHYYAISGPTLLVEYDNAQEGGNHIHSVWRDLRSDWGGDLLARHYAADHRLVGD